MTDVTEASQHEPRIEAVAEPGWVPSPRLVRAVSTLLLKLEAAERECSEVAVAK